MAHRSNAGADPELPGGPPKKLTGALLAYASRGAATGPLRPIIQAGIINRALGGPFVAPWEVDDLPPDIIDPIMAMVTELPDLRRGLQAVEAKKQEIRKQIKGDRIH